MPANGFNIGRDVTLDIVDPQRGVLRFSIATSFKADPVMKDIDSRGLDGVDRFDYLPGGHKLQFEFDRADSSVDDYFASTEVAYFQGQTSPNVSITETIRELNGGISQYRYQGVALKLTNGGEYKSDSPVKQTVEGMASRKIKVA